MRSDSKVFMYALSAAVISVLVTASYAQIAGIMGLANPFSPGPSQQTSAQDGTLLGTAEVHNHPISAGYLSATQPSSSADSISQPSYDAHYTLIPQALAATMTPTKKFILYATSDTGKVQLPTTDRIAVYSFNGSFPAPTIRVTQGDIVQITLVNRDVLTHSVDFHGSQLSAVPNFGAITPGQNKTFVFVAANPGVWAYHCEADNVFGLWSHPMKGMVGMLIVDPKNGYRPFSSNIITPNNLTSNFFYTGKTVAPLAREFSIIFGEQYLASAATSDFGTSVHDFDQLKMFNEIPTYAYVNAIPFGYSAPLLQLSPWNTASLGDVMNNANLLPDNPNPPLSALTTANSNGFTNSTHLHVVAGEHVRFFLMNAGEKVVSFHIVGEQLDQVVVGNTTVAKGVDTWLIPAYGSAIVDVVFEQPGTFVGVNHDYSMLFKGQLFVVQVHAAGTQSPANPSNAVPPPSSLPSTSIQQSKCLYGIGPNSHFENNGGDDNKFISRCVA